MLTFYDGIPMRGDLFICVRDVATGEITLRVEIRNKITFLAADVLVDLLAQRLTDAAPMTNQIYSMRMGSSNTPASRDDVNLGAPIIGKMLTDSNKVSGTPGSLLFSATLESGDANGQTLREAALFTRGTATSATETDPAGVTGSSPRMFCRQVHVDLPKVSAIALEYSWRIAFTA